MKFRQPRPAQEHRKQTTPQKCPQKFDVSTRQDELSRVSVTKPEPTKYSDYNFSEEPPETEPKSKQPIDGVKAPASLNEAMRRQWGALPREAQQWISEREAQAQQKITEQGQQLSELQRGVHASMPHLEHVERIARETGLTPDATLRLWAAADHFLKTNPEGAIRYLAAAHGVDLAGFSSDDPQLQQVREMQAQQFEADAPGAVAMASTATAARAAPKRSNRKIC